MAKKYNNKPSNRLRIASLLLIASAAVADETQLNFASPMGEEQWRMTGNRLRCGLSLVIPNYGVGYFEQYATKDPHFILRTWDPVKKVMPTLVLASPPVWKKGKNFMIAQSQIKPGEFGVFLPRGPAQSLLSFLSLGYEANFNYRSEQGFTTSIVLSPIRFQEVYTKYRRCLGSLLSFNYNDVKEVIIHFGTDSKLISEEEKVQLRRIAEYVAADQQVDVVHIVGYSDDIGRKGYNNAMSEFRAEAVQKYLLSLGVPKNKTYVTWYGAQKPIDRNDTDAGRAANRRVVIDLLKK
jgi:outer membrane protein OmpA-like peptidoglycan-associated protein